MLAAKIIRMGNHFLSHVRKGPAAGKGVAPAVLPEGGADWGRSHLIVLATGPNGCWELLVRCCSVLLAFVVFFIGDGSEVGLGLLAGFFAILVSLWCSFSQSLDAAHGYGRLIV